MSTAKSTCHVMLSWNLSMLTASTCNVIMSLTQFSSAADVPLTHNDAVACGAVIDVDRKVDHVASVGL